MKKTTKMIKKTEVRMFVINMRLATEIIAEYFIWIDALYLNQKSVITQYITIEFHWIIQQNWPYK